MRLTSWVREESSFTPASPEDLSVRSFRYTGWSPSGPPDETGGKEPIVFRTSASDDLMKSIDWGSKRGSSASSVVGGCISLSNLAVSAMKRARPVSEERIFTDPFMSPTWSFMTRRSSLPCWLSFLRHLNFRRGLDASVWYRTLAGTIVDAFNWSLIFEIKLLLWGPVSSPWSVGYSLNHAKLNISDHVSAVFPSVRLSSISANLVAARYLAPFGIRWISLIPLKHGSTNRSEPLSSSGSGGNIGWAVLLGLLLHLNPHLQLPLSRRTCAAAPLKPRHVAWYHPGLWTAFDPHGLPRLVSI